MLSYRIATSTPEVTAARALIESMYEKQGYIDQHNRQDFQRSFEPYFVSQHSTTIIAADTNCEPCGTISLVQNTKTNRLPMDAQFSAELHPLRAVHTNHLAEVCQFATDHTRASAHSTEISLGLFAHTLYVAQRLGITHLCFAVNPKHRAFYQALGSVQIGEEKSYGTLHTAPAVALCLNLSARVGTPTTFMERILSQTPSTAFLDQCDAHTTSSGRSR